MANKKKVEMTEDQIKTTSALMKADSERELKAAALEQYSFGQEYEYERRVQQGQWCLKQMAGMKLVLGCILMEIKERENLQTFANTLTVNFGGMSQRDAYYHMAFAKKCVDLRKIKEFGEKNWSKTLALLHSTTDEQLKEIEEKGINGKVLDEYDGMSVRDFKKLLKKYKDDASKVIKEEVKNIETEKKLLIKEVDRLKAFDPEGKDASWSVEQMQVIDKMTDELDTALRKFVKDPRILDHPELQAKIEGIQAKVQKRFKIFVADWDAYVNGEAE